MAHLLRLRLRRALSLSTALLPRIRPISAATTLSHSPATAVSRRHFHSSRPLCLSSASRSFSDVERIDSDTVLFEGCDYKHWLIVMDFGKDPASRPPPDQMVQTYVETAAKVIGSVEEAKKKIYACSTTTYTGFQVEVDQDTSKKFEGLPKVMFVLPDSYIDPVNKEYGGDKYIDGEIIPRPPPSQYGKTRRGLRPNDQRPRDSMPNQQGNQAYNQQGKPPYNQLGNPAYIQHGSMPQAGTGYPPQGPQQGFPHPQYSPPQQNYLPSGQADRITPMPGGAHHPDVGSDGYQSYQRSFVPPQEQNYNHDYNRVQGQLSSLPGNHGSDTPVGQYRGDPGNHAYNHPESQGGTHPGGYAPPGQIGVYGDNRSYFSSPVRGTYYETGTGSFEPSGAGQYRGDLGNHAYNHPVSQMSTHLGGHAPAGHIGVYGDNRSIFSSPVRGMYGETGAGSFEPSGAGQYYRGDSGNHAYNHPEGHMSTHPSGYAPPGQIGESGDKWGYFSSQMRGTHAETGAGSFEPSIAGQYCGDSRNHAYNHPEGQRSTHPGVYAPPAQIGVSGDNRSHFFSPVRGAYGQAGPGSFEPSIAGQYHGDAGYYAYNHPEGQRSTHSGGYAPLGQIGVSGDNRSQFLSPGRGAYGQTGAGSFEPSGAGQYRGNLAYNHPEGQRSTHPGGYASPGQIGVSGDNRSNLSSPVRGTYGQMGVRSFEPSGAGQYRGDSGNHAYNHSEGQSSTHPGSHSGYPPGQMRVSGNNRNSYSSPVRGTYGQTGAGSVEQSGAGQQRQGSSGDSNAHGKGKTPEGDNKTEEEMTESIRRNMEAIRLIHRRNLMKGKIKQGPSGDSYGRGAGYNEQSNPSERGGYSPGAQTRFNQGLIAATY